MSASSNPQPHQHAQHEHAHHHHHPHDAHDYAEGNREHFDAHADQFDAWPRAKERAQRSAAAILAAVPLNKDSSSALEFASGTGLVAKDILPYVKDLVGIDISAALVERCNQRFKEEGAGEGSYAIAANIERDDGVLADRKFDLVYCTSAYHHFADPLKITKLLAGYLKPGGHLIIIDQIPKGGEVIPDAYKSCVVRYGFLEEDIKPYYSAAGLEFLSYVQVESDAQDAELFIAKGILPSSDA